MDLRSLPNGVQNQLTKLLSARNATSVAQTSKAMYALIARNPPKIVGDVATMVKRALKTATDMNDVVNQLRLVPSSQLASNGAVADWYYASIHSILERNKYAEYMIKWSSRNQYVLEAGRKYTPSNARTQIEARASFVSDFPRQLPVKIIVKHGSATGELHLNRYFNLRFPRFYIEVKKNPNVRKTKAAVEQYNFDAVRVGAILWRAASKYGRPVDHIINVEVIERPGMNIFQTIAERLKMRQNIVSQSVSRSNNMQIALQYDVLAARRGALYGSRKLRSRRIYDKSIRARRTAK